MKNSRSESHFRMSRFPKKLLITTILLSIVIFSVSWMFNFFLQQEYRSHNAQTIRRQELVSMIVYLDMVLTLSTQMGVLTTQSVWGDDYRKFEMQLRKAFEELVAIRPQDPDIGYIIQAQQANDRLVEIEQKTFALIEDNKLEEAQTILSSREYQTDKRRYANGISQYQNALQQYLITKKSSQIRSTYLTFFVNALGVVFLIILWTTVSRRISRYQTQKTLYEKNLRRESLAMQASMDGMAILDQNGCYTYLNEAHARIYGYDHPRELIQKSWQVLYAPDELERFNNEIMPLFQKQGQWRGEAIGKKKDNTLFHQELSLTKIDEGGLICVVRDITARKRTEEAFKSILEGTASQTGSHFFNSLAQQIATALHTPYVIVAELIGETKSEAQSIAFWETDHLGKNFRYALEGTPCQKVMCGHLCFYPKNVQGLFPKDQDLKDMNVESYLGIPLANTKGDIIGHLVVMDHKPMGEAFLETSLLKIFAMRAASELERMRNEEQIKRQRAFFRQVIDLDPNFVFAKD
ncbi:PAS domain S-box protein, partial [PVC group bacterium]|nr:PAS domain S-box protein [PVC group bacterium]